MESVQNKARRGKKVNKISRASVIGGTLSSSVIHVYVNLKYNEDTHTLTFLENSFKQKNFMMIKIKTKRYYNYRREGVSKLWPMDQLQSTVCFCRILKLSTVLIFKHLTPTKICNRNLIWPTKVKIFTSL